MNNEMSLKEAERRVFVSFFQDGLVDIFLGLVFSQFAIAPFLSDKLGDLWSSALFVPIWLLAMIGIWALRRYVVQPRVGVVRFGGWRRKRLLWYNVIMLVLGLGALVLGFLSFDRFEILPEWAPMLRFSMMLLVGFTLSGFFLNYSRLYLYGVLVAAAPAVGEWLWLNMGATHHGLPITFGFASGLMILVGLVQFVRLLRANPIASSPLEAA